MGERELGPVLVTGGASGLGAAVAAAVAGAGGTPVLLDRVVPAFDADHEIVDLVDAELNRPEDVADAVLFALRQPPGCEVRELFVAPSLESSWP